MTKKLQARVNQLKSDLTDKKIAEAAYKYFVSATPVDTGNAKRKTTLANNEIRAQYPYAKRLDQGWSKQAPNGMIKPTIEFLRKYIRQLTGK